jgi:hypothetical protein
MEIRDELQKIAVESPAYGYRRVAAELRHPSCRERPNRLS